MKKPLRKMTKQRLKNIGLYYLKRFESSVDNLRQVLKRRVNDYAFHNPTFNKLEAYTWIEELLTDFVQWHYLDDARYTELKVRDYLNAGKPERYIKIKLRQKGIMAEDIDNALAATDYNPREMAEKIARKKKLGPYRKDEESQRLNRQKDLAVLVRAGFDYDVAQEVIGSPLNEEFSDY